MLCISSVAPKKYRLHMRRMPTAGGAGWSGVERGAIKWTFFFGICSSLSFFLMLAVYATCFYAGARLIQDGKNAFGKVFQDALSVAQSILKNPKLLPGGSAIELTVSAIPKQKSSLIEGIEKVQLGDSFGMVKRSS